jgi:type IV secretion system protein TrbJ
VADCGRKSGTMASRVWGVLLPCAVASLGMPERATAQWTVFDPSVFAETVQNYGQAVRQVAQGATQIANQATMIVNQATALKKLRNPSIRDLAGTFGNLGGDFGGSRATVVYGASNPTGSLQTTYPGGQPSSAYRPQRAAQVSDALGTATAVLAAAQDQTATFAAALQQLNDMRAQLGTIQGHEEALELANTIGLFQAGESLLSRQAQQAANNLAAVRVAQEVTDSAQPEANAHAWYVQIAVDAPHRPLVSFRPSA